MFPAGPWSLSEERDSSSTLLGSVTRACELNGQGQVNWRESKNILLAFNIFTWHGGLIQKLQSSTLIHTELCWLNCPPVIGNRTFTSSILLEREGKGKHICGGLVTNEGGLGLFQSGLQTQGFLFPLSCKGADIGVCGGLTSLSTAEDIQSVDFFFVRVPRPERQP